MSLASSYTYIVRENASEDDNSYIVFLNQHTIHKNVSTAAGNSHHICSNSKDITSVGNSRSFMNVCHGRLGHPNKIVLQVLSQIHDQVHVNATLEFCEACQYGKLHQSVFSLTRSLHTTEPFQVKHMDVWGPTSYLSIEGYRFYITFVDDFTRYTWIYPFHLKSETATICLQFHRMIERQFDTKVKCFRFDWGGEFGKL